MPTRPPQHCQPNLKSVLSRGWAQTVVGVVMLTVLTACGAKEPKTVSLTGMVYNYSQEGYAWVKVNDTTAGSGLKKVVPGSVSGGAGICCFELAVGATQVQVQVEPSIGEGFTTTATIEKWWPDLAHYGVVHILPGRKVVMEVRAVDTWPRRDLLEAQLKVTGTKKVVDYTGPMNDAPMQRTDGVK
jgi:hypothetical protein